MSTHCVLWDRYQSQKEELSGGTTTTFDRSLTAFNRLASNIKNMEKIHKFNRGNQIFKASWKGERDKKFAGLGPLFNSHSCMGCHFMGGRGRNKFANEKEFRSMIFKLSFPPRDSYSSPWYSYGEQIQDKSISPNKIPIEVSPDVVFQEHKGKFPDGEEYTLRRSKYEFKNWNYGKPKEFAFSPRVAPVIYGMGLLSLIPEEKLREIADPEDKDGDGISGRINDVDHYITYKKAMGRFGWKASHPDIVHILLIALHQDMGITSYFFRRQNCEPKQIRCRNAQKGSLEITKEMFDDLHYYTMAVAVPARRNVQDSEVLKGRRIFEDIGCAKCHIRKFITGNDPNYPELSNQVIYPYTDLLLHDMGEGLADGFEEFSASGREWRTAPLWGIGMYPLLSQHNELLHDGRARGIQEAILWHGGESEKSKQSFMNLTKSERTQLIEYIKSL